MNEFTLAIVGFMNLFLLDFEYAVQLCMSELVYTSNKLKEVGSQELYTVTDTILFEVCNSSIQIIVISCDKIHCFVSLRFVCAGALIVWYNLIF